MEQNGLEVYNSGLIGFNENAGNPLLKRINDSEIGNLPSALC